MPLCSIKDKAKVGYALAKAIEGAMNKYIHVLRSNNLQSYHLLMRSMQEDKVVADFQSCMTSIM